MSSTTYVLQGFRFSDCKVRAYGQCCPHACPIGLPHPVATCDRNARMKCAEQEGYFCSRTYMSEPVVRLVGKDVDDHFLATCCPRQCPKDMIALNDGHCIRSVGVGESCWRHEQCPFSTECLRGDNCLLDWRTYEWKNELMNAI